MPDGSQLTLSSSGRVRSAERSDRVMVGWMRLALATSILTSVILLPQPPTFLPSFSIYLVCLGYVMHSAVLCARSGRTLSDEADRLVHWIDVGWFALIVVFTGGSESSFFLAFFFPILTASFRWGFSLGGRITIASAIALSGSHLISGGDADVPLLLLRTAFLVSLGYMSAYWGESTVGLKRRLALLRDVSQLSNPRFGVDQTITSTMESIRKYFDASSCLLVMREQDPLRYNLRCVSDDDIPKSVSAEPVDPTIGEPLMADSPDIAVYFSRWWQSRSGGQIHIRNLSNGAWTSQHSASARQLAELLSVRSYISAPIHLRKSEGRFYVLSENRCYGKGDVAFLFEVVAQAFPVIENIDLVDRMASEAARDEREKMALDLHDTAVQPYVGLSMGLAAICMKARPDNPLMHDLAQLRAMAADTISELRRYAGTIKRADNGEREPLFSLLLRRQADHVKRFYGLHIDVDVPANLTVSDRLIAQIMQLISEGLSNICKHTVAQQGLVRMRCIDGWMHIDIANEGASGDVGASFMPRSITARAAVLGGRVTVQQGQRQETIVAIRIPV